LVLFDVAELLQCVAACIFAGMVDDGVMGFLGIDFLVDDVVCFCDFT
jgi:hypothetical protein